MPRWIEVIFLVQSSLAPVRLVGVYLIWKAGLKLVQLPMAGNMKDYIVFNYVNVLIEFHAIALTFI